MGELTFYKLDHDCIVSDKRITSLSRLLSHTSGPTGEEGCVSERSGREVRRGMGQACVRAATAQVHSALRYHENTTWSPPALDRIDPM